MGSHKSESEKASQHSQEKDAASHKSGEAEGEDGAAKPKDKYDRSGPHPIIGLIIYLVIQFIALVLMTVATPLEWFKVDQPYVGKMYPDLAGSSKPICVTAWGMRHGCTAKKYHTSDFTNSFCYRVRINFRVIEAFCIMAVGFMILGMILGILSVMQKATKMAVAAIAGLSMFISLIPWGVTAGMYYQKPCCNTRDWLTTPVTECFSTNPHLLTEDVPPFKDIGKYGASFGLCVAAWALEVIGMIFAALPWI